MFTFINEDEVWLHCDIQACNTKEEDCSQQVCEEKTDEAPFSVSGQGPKKEEGGERKKRSANVFTISQKRVKRDDSNVVKNSQVYSEDKKLFDTKKLNFLQRIFILNCFMNQIF